MLLISLISGTLLLCFASCTSEILFNRFLVVFGTLVRPAWVLALRMAHNSLNDLYMVRLCGLVVRVPGYRTEYN
jgi:hypothetical protein